MEIVRSIEDIEKPFKNAVITIGNFDGVHIGHQALFHAVMEKADAIDGTSVAMTFDPHPLKLLAPTNHTPLITLNEQKSELIARTGIEVLVCLPFTSEFAAIPARRFVRDLLIERIGMRAIVVGRDYTFGRNREGSLELLRQWSSELNYEVLVVNWIQSANGTPERISSTRIRELVMQGRIGEANRLLGRYYQIRGVVETGRRRGAGKLGFPTANIRLQDGLCPKQGIYAVTVEIDGCAYHGVANIGYSPTFDDHIFTIEVHILDFKRTIYGRPIRVNFIERLRDEIRFESLEALSAQIGQDIVRARALLANVL